MRRLLAPLLLAIALSGPSQAVLPSTPFRILVNHLGYDLHGSKKIVVQADGPAPLTTFQVIDGQGRPVFEGPLGRGEKVDRWRSWLFFRGEFSALDRAGSYRARVNGPAGAVVSETFTVRPQLLPDSCLS